MEDKTQIKVIQIWTTTLFILFFLLLLTIIPQSPNINSYEFKRSHVYNSDQEALFGSFLFTTVDDTIEFTDLNPHKNRKYEIYNYGHTLSYFYQIYNKNIPSETLILESGEQGEFILISSDLAVDIIFFGLDWNHTYHIEIKVLEKPETRDTLQFKVFEWLKLFGSYSVAVGFAMTMGGKIRQFGKKFSLPRKHALLLANFFGCLLILKGFFDLYFL